MLGGYNRLYGAASLGAGVLYIMGKDTAPGCEWSITLYSRAMGTGSSNLPLVRGGYSYIVRNADKSKGEYRVTYQKSEYMGHWWSPDGERMVMEFRQGNQTKIQMTTWAKGSTANLNAAFPYADTEYRFLQWSKDGRMLLIYIAWRTKRKATSGTMLKNGIRLPRLR